ncbi:unnamed protein product, partial [marine sediment metagenome]
NVAGQAIQTEELRLLDQFVLGPEPFGPLEFDIWFRQVGVATLGGWRWVFWGEDANNLYQIENDLAANTLELLVLNAGAPTVITLIDTAIADELLHQLIIRFDGAGEWSGELDGAPFGPNNDASLFQNNVMLFDNNMDAALYVRQINIMGM